MSLPSGQPACASHRLRVRSAVLLRTSAGPAPVRSGGAHLRQIVLQSAPEGRSPGSAGSPSPSAPAAVRFSVAPVSASFLGSARTTPALSSADAPGCRFAVSADLRFLSLRLLCPPGPAPPGCRPFAGSGSAPWLRSARTSFVASAFCRSAPFQGTCLCYAPPPQAPAELHSGRFPSSPLRFSGLLAAPALASGCSVPLRGTASAGSGRTPFVLTPPLRPAQAQARSGSASGQPASPFPPSAGHSAGSVTGTPASAPWAD